MNWLTMKKSATLLLILGTMFYSSVDAMVNSHIKQTADDSIRLTHSSTPFKELINFSIKFLRGNIDKIKCQKNESGFIRINIPLTQELKDKFGIAKIRFNYWTSDANVEIHPESVHTHPNYFESIIINGGYTHELYENTNDGDVYNLYQVTKKSDFTRELLSLGCTNLKLLKIESFKPGSIVIFDKELIHRVIKSLPETLSFNVVFDDNEEVGQYNVYITPNGLIEDVKTEREEFSSEKSKFFVAKLIKIIDSFTEKFKA